MEVELLHRHYPPPVTPLGKLVACLLAAGALSGAAQAAPPSPGTVVPGRSLGGVSLGATRADVERSWGLAHGTCRSCTRPTWYFNSFAFRPEGAGATFRNGRVSALFTLWSPPGWHTNRGVAIGDDVASVTAVYGALHRVTCDSYEALVLPLRGTTTAVYIVGAKVWGFALLARGEAVCR